MLEATGYHTNRHNLSEIQARSDLVLFETHQPQHTSTMSKRGYVLEADTLHTWNVSTVADTKLQTRWCLWQQA